MSITCESKEDSEQNDINFAFQFQSKTHFINQEIILLEMRKNYIKGGRGRGKASDACSAITSTKIHKLDKEWKHEKRIKHIGYIERSLKCRRARLIKKDIYPSLLTQTSADQNTEQIDEDTRCSQKVYVYTCTHVQFQNQI